MSDTRRTAQDFYKLKAAIEQDLRGALAKMTELGAWLAALPLPDEPSEFNEKAGMALVQNTGHEYTELSLAEELRSMGADEAFVERALRFAGNLKPSGPLSSVTGADSPAQRESAATESPGGDS